MPLIPEDYDSIPDLWRPSVRAEDFFFVTGGTPDPAPEPEPVTTPEIPDVQASGVTNISETEFDRLYEELNRQEQDRLAARQELTPLQRLRADAQRAGIITRPRTSVADSNWVHSEANIRIERPTAPEPVGNPFDERHPRNQEERDMQEHLLRIRRTQEATEQVSPTEADLEQVRLRMRTSQVTDMAPQYMQNTWPGPGWRDISIEAEIPTRSPAVEVLTTEQRHMIEQIKKEFFPPSTLQASIKGPKDERRNWLKNKTEMPTTTTRPVLDYRGEDVSHLRGSSDLIKLRYGAMRGKLALRSDSNVVQVFSPGGGYYFTLLSDNPTQFYLSTSLSASPVYCMPDQGFELETDRRTGRLTLRGNLRHGVVGAAMEEGYFSSGLHDNEGTWYMNEAVAELNGIRRSPTNGHWMRHDHPDFNWFAGNGNASYHYYDRKPHPEAESALFTVGVEVEKEDARGIAYPHTLLFDQTKWIKERDGSLQDGSGFELISPTHDLLASTLMNTIRNNDALLQLVNAKYTGRCGGHIHAGQRNLSGLDVFQRVIVGWLPLLYSLYPARLNRRYCAAKGKRAIECGDKYQAIRLLRNRIEFRIFPAVRDVDNLEWRLGLVRIIMLNPLTEFDQLLPMIDSGQSVVMQHLGKVLSSESLDSLSGRVREWIKRLDANPDFIVPQGRVTATDEMMSYPTDEHDYSNEQGKRVMSLIEREDKSQQQRLASHMEYLQSRLADFLEDNTDYPPARTPDVNTGGTPCQRSQLNDLMELYPGYNCHNEEVYIGEGPNAPIRAYQSPGSSGSAHSWRYFGTGGSNRYRVPDLLIGLVPADELTWIQDNRMGQMATLPSGQKVTRRQYNEARGRLMSGM